MPRLVLKNSTVANKAPLPGDLNVGELALNCNAASPAAYLKDSAGAIVKIAGVGAIGGTPATETVAGIAELATQVETNAGMDDARIVTPLKLATYVSQNLWIDGGSAVSNFGSAPAVLDGGRA